MTERRHIPTNIVLPVDPQFVDHFCAGGWQKVEAMYGKRCVQRWTAVVGRDRLKQMRRDAVKGKRRDA